MAGQVSPPGRDPLQPLLTAVGLAEPLPCTPKCQSALATIPTSLLVLVHLVFPRGMALAKRQPHRICSKPKLSPRES